MKRILYVQGKKIVYKLRRNKRARRMLLSVYGDGSVVVTTPYAPSLGSAERFLREKARWLFKQLKHFKNNPVVRIHKRGSRAHYLRHREAARSLVRARLEAINTHYGFSYNRVSIRNQKTCWGSCSAKKNLNFNYKLLFLPAELYDYVIIHELCHLEELNHSPRFWQLVARVCPDYPLRKGELRKM